MEDAITWVTLRSYSTPIEAHLARGHLETEGVPCFLRDEHTIGMNWLYSDLLGGVRLCVPASELDRAREILAGKLFAEEPKELTCPECGSSRVQDLSQRKKWALFSVALLHIPLPFARKNYLCANCGHSFRMRA